MAFVSAQDSRVAVGLLNASGYATQYSINEMQAALETSVLGLRSKQFIVGQQWADAQIDMILDTSAAANGQYDAITDLKSADPFAISFAPEGFAAGDPVILIDGLETVFNSSAAIADVVRASMSAISTGAFDHGDAIDDFTEITADTNGAGLDGTAASTNGGVAHLHVTAFSGLTSDVVIIQHSTDSGFTAPTTLATFTTVTGVTSQRLVVAAGTTVNRYLRVVDDVTGTGSITRQVSFARR